MKRAIALLTLFGVLLSSCSTTYYTVSLKDELSSIFVGKKHSEVITTIGAPTREVSDGLGGTILVYENIKANSLTYNFSQSISHTKTDIERGYIHCYINTDHTCYKIETNYTKALEKENTAGLVWSIIGTILGVSAIAGAIAYYATMR